MSIVPTRIKSKYLLVSEYWALSFGTSGCQLSAFYGFAPGLNIPRLTKIPLGSGIWRLRAVFSGAWPGWAHLAEMIALLGPRPPALIARSYLVLQYQWLTPLINSDGKSARMSQIILKALFFDSDGLHASHDHSNCLRAIFVSRWWLSSLFLI